MTHDLPNYDMLIGGEWVQAENGKTFESLNPATGKAWCRIPEATATDVARAVNAAKIAFNGRWAQMTPTARGKCLHHLGDLLAEHSEELGRIETRDTGKMLKETAWQARYIAEYFRYFGGAADKLQGETLPIDKPDLFVFTHREPLGVIAAIIPWNSQMFLSATKIGPALAAGNTIIVKASEHASAPLLAFGRLIEKAGIPKGVINIVTGHGEVCGKALTSHPDIARIAFTGGTRAAKQVIANSAENFASVSLELGGKSPFLVFEDADLRSAVNGCVAGIFGATGQSCVAGSRLYVHHAIADAFIEKMIAIAKDIRIGDPLVEDTQMGPLCTKDQLNHIERQIDIAVEEGGIIKVGGGRPAGLRGCYFEPTIIDCPHNNMTLLNEELFGPVLTVQRFEYEEEAVRLANQSRYGLAAGVFTKDNARALRLTKLLKAGVVWINTYRVISPIAAFGGMKQSGNGREAGLQALYDYSTVKTVWVNLSNEPIANPFKLN